MAVDRKQINDFRARTMTTQTGVVTFVCECVDSACRRPVALSLDEYAEMRVNDQPILFLNHLSVADEPLLAERAFIADVVELRGVTQEREQL